MAGQNSRPLKDLVEAMQRLGRAAESGNKSVAISELASTIRICAPFISAFGMLATFGLAEMQAKANKMEEAAQIVNTLKELVDQDIQKGCERTNDSFSRYLIRVKRAIEFTRAFFQQVCSMSPRENSLAAPLKTAYDQVFQSYHGRSVRETFSTLLETFPSKSQLLATLGENENSATVLMQDFIPAAYSVVSHIDNIFCATKEGRELLRMI